MRWYRLGILGIGGEIEVLTGAYRPTRRCRKWRSRSKACPSRSSPSINRGSSRQNRSCRSGRSRLSVPPLHPEEFWGLRSPSHCAGNHTADLCSLSYSPTPYRKTCISPAQGTSSSPADRTHRAQTTHTRTTRAGHSGPGCYKATRRWRIAPGDWKIRSGSPWRRRVLERIS